jgi:hypothetical protein
MKIASFLLLFCAFATFGATLTAQENTPGFPPAAYQKTLSAFEVAKLKHNNTYTFGIYTASFTETMTTTTMVVENGKVVARHYKRENPYRKELNKSWSETGAQIGKHKDEGHAACTLDEVYAYVKGNQATVSDKPVLDIELVYYFEVDKTGIISTAGTSMIGCMDDCFRGYKIRDLSWGSNSKAVDTKTKNKKQKKAKK